jgi:threonine dehydrogenase-like Zn-dependent dehydrogenase
MKISEPFKVTIEERPLPKLEHPDDALIKVTTAAICGSDLHMYQGRTAAQGGLCFGPYFPIPISISCSKYK